MDGVAAIGDALFGVIRSTTILAHAVSRADCSPNFSTTSRMTRYDQPWAGRTLDGVAMMVRDATRMVVARAAATQGEDSNGLGHRSTSSYA